MMLIVYAAVFALVPFLVSLCLQKRGKCSIWWVLVAPVIGLFLFCILVLFLFSISRDM